VAIAGLLDNPVEQENPAAVRNIINVVPFLRMPMHGFKYPSGTVIKVSTDVAGTVVLIGWEE